MASKSITKGLKRTALSVALGMCFAGSVYAQSNSTGSIAGQTAAGGTVVVENAATGFRREVTADSNGNYRVGSLATGTYTVTADGKTRTVNVTIGGTAEGTTTLDVVSVQGSAINAIDVASVESTTILTAEQVAKIPVPRDITSVALLAPGTVKGDAAFGNLASFGGGAVSENQYFVNGFNISNSFKNLDFGQVPFEAIAEQQVKTGGYGAEFGRATGGVINLVTKRGSNEFKAGANIFYSPQSLKETNPDIYYNDPRYPDGKRLIADNSKDERGTTTSASVWASGALIQDRLFAYALIQYAKTDDVNTFGSGFSSNNTKLSQTVPTWLVKLDWNINDSHILEFTGFSDKIKQETDVFFNTTPLSSRTGLSGGANMYPALTPGGCTVFNAVTCTSPTDKPASDATIRGAYLGTVFNENGGESYSLKYTGYLTDNFTISALYGHGESSRSNYGVAANGTVAEYTGDVGGPVAGCPIIQALAAFGPAPPSCWFIGVIGTRGSKDERDQFRIDADWALGDHLIRFGIDTDKFTSIDGEAYEGGAIWRYNGPANTADGVRKRIFQSGATVEVNSEAYYIEDRWQVTPNFLAYVGLRWDTFENVNGAGEQFVEIKNQFGPRLGFSWDVNGDSSFKVYGNAGRYSLPLTATVAVRGASASLFAEEFYSYTGIDPVTGAPLGLVNTGNAFCGNCPTRYLNNEFGVGKNPLTIADQSLSPMYQDEYILGFQAKLTDNMSGGVRGIYRDLKAAIDDQCDYRPIYAYAYENDIPFNPYNPGFAFCHLYNPGEDATFLVDIDGDGTLETFELTAAVGGPPAKRTYKAVEFFVEGNWDKFFMQASYTWSKSYGNTEGGVKSDIGQDDTGTTQDFDYPELTIGSLGYLPNDRRHSFKIFGNYELSDEWSIGANLLVQSGRPVNCFGFLGGSNTSHYANGYFSCSPNPTGLPGDGTGNNGFDIVPRGSAGRTEWSRNLDLNVAYKPNWADGHMMFKVDVFNVLNEHAVTTVVEQGENAAGTPQPDRYKTPTGFQTPRSVRFMVQYDF
ncbi:MAG: TonB-dependent receptor [Gammaproteobacteria bacterium]|nr:TonB-dependent receptor [Gammaproteobacteria bacterium]